MKNFALYLSLAMFLVAFSSCELVEGIFKAGVWVGILAVVGIIALIIFIVAKVRRK